MTDHLIFAIAQLNPTVGDVAGNIAKLRRARAEAAASTPISSSAAELCVSGYPPEDLVLKPAFVDACEAAVRDFAAETASGPAIIIGMPWRQDGKLYNAALLLDGGKIAAVRFKHDLPNYGVFDEKRVFAAGPRAGPDRLSRRPPRPHGLRGHVDAGYDRDAGRDRRRAARSSSTARPSSTTSATSVSLGRARGSGKRPAAALRQPDLRPGRAGLRRRLLRARRRVHAPPSGAGLARGGAARLHWTPQRR